MHRCHSVPKYSDVHSEQPRGNQQKFLVAITATLVAIPIDPRGTAAIVVANVGGPVTKDEAVRKEAARRLLDRFVRAHE
jgi:hypothetical protein